MEIVRSVVGDLALLSPREQAVGRLLIRGETNRAIGSKLGFSVAKVQYCVHLMTAGLELANRVELAVWIAMHPESLVGVAVKTALVMPASVA